MDAIVSQINSTPNLSNINVFPVKSIAGISLSTAQVEKQGLQCDRRFMVASLDGKMITARTHPQMVKIKAIIEPDGLILCYPGLIDLHVTFNDLKMEEVNTTVWSDTFTAYSTTKEANQWFTSILGTEAQLLFSGEQSNRMREKIQTNVSFADGYPLLVISEASLTELNKRSSSHHTMAQFRTNLVVSGNEAFIEDSWKRIRIGEVEFEVVKPCQRCILTTVNPNTAQYHPNKEPLKTFSTFRADDSGNVYFGQNLIAKNEGTINVGDKIEVLETKEKEYYSDSISTVATQQVTVDPINVTEDSKSEEITISLNGNLFKGNTQDPLLNQAEAAGLSINNSCRAGLCGACRVTLESGDVEQEDSPALNQQLKDAGMILACCSVPKTDIEVVD
ncbi:MOSC domain-containing protein [Aliivibrio finisterrensis]|uniref:YcbX family protein n=1 Tax=Aliivibrio finisterrensis TaxID=511998 RepID=UPI00101F2110|nr:YcbX family protein [Aliivibrio finisterrensis]RYU67690.1 MOSC domain-containing protein [Aliivibrio finisterrensis]RYU73982.1 MOSC domain-containing protein [Aliivibrio finisterrensis]